MLSTKTIRLASFLTVSLVTTLATPSIVLAEQGPFWEYIPSYVALDAYEDPPCNGVGLDHESEVKYYWEGTVSNPTYFRVDEVKQWGRVTTWGFARDQEWSIHETLYYRVENSQYVLDTVKGPQPSKIQGQHCWTMDSNQIEAGDVLLSGGALVVATTRYDWCIATEEDCVSVFTEYSSHSHFLEAL